MSVAPLTSCSLVWALAPCETITARPMAIAMRFIGSSQIIFYFAGGKPPPADYIEIVGVQIDGIKHCREVQWGGRAAMPPPSR